MKKTYACAMIPGISILAFLSIAGSGMAVEPDLELKELGKYIFFDNISVPKRMSCSTCHDPAAGWTFKNSGTNLHQVAVTGADPHNPERRQIHNAGTLKPPSNAYATSIPFQECNKFPTGFCGGNFWNGRAEGNDQIQFPFPQSTEHISTDDPIFDDNGYAVYVGPVADQALNPFGNPVEQNIERVEVCQHVASSQYAALFKEVWGSIDCELDVDNTFKRIAVSLAAYQASDEVNSFSSKRDIALDTDADRLFPLDGLTTEENRGHDLFYGRARCSFCHRSDVVDGTGPFERYTDDSYHNIGTPRNYEIPGSPEPDDGLAGHTGIDIDKGEFKTPTLRNVDKRPGKGFIKAYGHNGWFKSLESIVHFYNTAAVKPCTDPTIRTEKEALAQNCWPAPEHPDTSAIGFIIGNLGLSAEDEAAIVAYLKTLTDTETPKPPPPYNPSK